MVYPATEDMTSEERAFMINATEIDVLPGVRGDLPEPLASASGAELAAVLLPLVDKGWIEVCPVVPWTAPDGSEGYQPGPAFPREDLPALLADDGRWEYAEDRDFTGGLTLTLTEAGERIPR
ncbi:hypothetical protein [Streptomyces thermolilacinus]|nr:hypothetical protein [Streptomyces thermolilacinus]